MVAVHQHLRTESVQFHRRLDQQPLLRNILNGSMAIDSYREIVLKMYGFYVPIEATIIDRSVQGLVPLAVQSRCEKRLLLGNDLKALGFSDSQIMSAALCEKLPSLDSTLQIWGCLYVLEGSMLGGRQIASILRKNLALTKDNGAAYYWGYGEQTIPMWKSFLQDLEGAVCGEDDLVSVVRATQQTFACLDAWLSEKI